MQKKIFLPTLLIAIMWCSIASAAANRVVFYPSGADYSQSLKAQIYSDVNGQYVSFILSGQAVPETFSIAPLSKGVAVNDVSWTRSDLSQSPAAIELGKKIDQLKFKLNAVLSQKKAVDGGILFWNERGKIQQSKSAELDRIANLVVANLGKLYEKAAKFDVKIKELQDLINELRRKREEISGRGKMVWNVKVYVASKGAKSADFKIGYMLRNCGWSPKYKLDAYPESGKVKFTFEAEIRQGSGINFKDCEIALATVKKRSRIAPPGLRRWVIEPEPEIESMPVRAMMDEANYAMEAAAPRKLKGAGSPRRVSKATYSLWEMGKKSIPAGSSRKYAVESESWKVDFLYLARPSLTQDIFVSAKAVLNDAKDYPSGPALVFMEGTMIGKRNFVFSGKETTMFFGSDPMFKAERKTLEKQSGEKGIFGSKQTYNWKYSIELVSGRKKSVAVKVQEASPVSGDKRIKLVVNSTPKAKIKDDQFEWKVDVPAGGKAAIEYSVEMKAPDDMKINFGIGR